MVDVAASPASSVPGPGLGAFSNVELRHLAALDAVAVEGTFGRAATRLGYTQSAVSQQIAVLEKTLGAPVFDRPGGPRPVRLTPLGKLVLTHARDILSRARATADAVERFKAGEGGRIDIGTFQSVSSVLLPAIVTQLRVEHPSSDIRLVESDVSTVPMVLSGELDATFLVGPCRDEVDSVILLDDPYVVVARRGDFPSGAVAVETLDGLPMVAYPPVCDVPRIEGALNAMGVQPVVVFRTADNGAVINMVRAGMGAAIMPLLAVDIEADDDDLCMHTIEPVLGPRQICLAWQSQRTLSPLAQRFIDLSIEVCRELATREATYHALASR